MLAVDWRLGIVECTNRIWESANERESQPSPAKRGASPSSLYISKTQIHNCHGRYLTNRKEAAASMHDLLFNTGMILRLERRSMSIFTLRDCRQLRSSVPMVAPTARASWDYGHFQSEWTNALRPSLKGKDCWRCNRTLWITDKSMLQDGGNDAAKRKLGGTVATDRYDIFKLFGNLELYWHVRGMIQKRTKKASMQYACMDRYQKR